MQRKSLTFAYAIAVVERNASGSKIVSAPTCGFSRVIPALLYLNNFFMTLVVNGL